MAIRKRPVTVNMKLLRASAKAQRMPFHKAAAVHMPRAWEKIPIARGMGRCSHANMEQSYWNGHSYIFVDDIEDTTQREDYSDRDVCKFDEIPPWTYGTDGEAHEPSPIVLGSLSDIAKPAKRKGPAREFEVIDSVTRAIVFEDEEWQDDRTFDDSVNDDWDEWVELYGGPQKDVPKKLSYASVVKGKKI